MRPLATDQWLAKGEEELGRVLRVSLSFMCVCTVCVHVCVCAFIGRGEYTSYKSLCVVINFYLKPKILLTFFDLRKIASLYLHFPICKVGILVIQKMLAGYLLCSRCWL